jgi:hypothetical protein
MVVNPQRLRYSLMMMGQSLLMVGEAHPTIMMSRAGLNA